MVCVGIVNGYADFILGMRARALALCVYARATIDGFCRTICLFIHCDRDACIERAIE